MRTKFLSNHSIRRLGINKVKETKKKWLAVHKIPLLFRLKRSRMTSTYKFLRLHSSNMIHLVLAGERRNVRALVLIKSGADDLTVAELGLTVRLLLPGESVLHPVLVVTVGVVLASVGATRLLAVGGGLSGLNGTSEKVAKLKGLDKVGVPDHAAVLGADLGEHLVDVVDPEK